MTIESAELRHEPLQRLLADVAGGPLRSATAAPLGGGLESAVARVRLEYEAPSGKPGVRHVVVKRLDGVHRREAAVHRIVGGHDFAPRCLGTVETGESTYLVLEFVRPHVRWPWQKTDHTRGAMRQLARVHAIEPSTGGIPSWDYDDELGTRAAITVRTAEQHADVVPEIDLRASLRPLRRLVERLPRLRADLQRTYGRTFIHGDAHPGNAILRIREGAPRTVFIDWARSRIGSPLEDVSSWLQTLRYWEPAAARRHDTLLREYLDARGVEMTRSLRDAYWAAAGSNTLAGALHFQIVRAAETRGRERVRAGEQAREWLRVIRRAEACTG